MREAIALSADTIFLRQSIKAKTAVGIADKAHITRPALPGQPMCAPRMGNAAMPEATDISMGEPPARWLVMWMCCSSRGRACGRI